MVGRRLGAVRVGGRVLVREGGQQGPGGGPGQRGQGVLVRCPARAVVVQGQADEVWNAAEERESLLRRCPFPRTIHEGGEDEGLQQETPRGPPPPGHSSPRATGPTRSPTEHGQVPSARAGPDTGHAARPSKAAPAGFWARGAAGEAGWGGGDKRLTALAAAAEVPEDVIALLGESDLVHGVPDEARLEQPARVLAGLPPLGKAFHVMVEPVDHVRAWEHPSREALSFSSRTPASPLPAPFPAGASSCPPSFPYHPSRTQPYPERH